LSKEKYNMDLLLKELKKLCHEEGIEFSDFIKRFNCPKRAVNQIGDYIGESDD
jgi:hypothetical protein